MSDWDTNFCQNLRYLRQTCQISQTEMARILGVSVTTYRRIERCTPSVRLHGGRVRRVCDHFLISADGILRQNWQREE